MSALDPRLVRRSRAVRRYLVAGVVVGVLTALVVVAQAALIAAAVARLFAAGPVFTIAIGIALCFAVRAALHWVHTVASTHAAVGVKAELRHEIADDLLDPRRLGPQPNSARVVSLLGPGLNAFDGYVGRFLPQLILALIVPGLVVVTVLVIDPLSALIIGITLPLSVGFMILVGLHTRDTLDRRWAELERLGRHFADVLDGLLVLKTFGRRQEDGLHAVGRRHHDETMRTLRIAFLSALVLDLVATLSVALVAVSVGLRVVEDDLSLQRAMMILLLAPEAYLPIRRLGMSYHESTEGAAAVSDALDLLDHPRHSGSSDPDKIDMAADLVLEQVVVQHAGRTSPALFVNSERIRPGEFVAVTGASGSGKSTLLDLLLGFVQPASGRLLIGNALNMNDVDPERWRRTLAWVPQFPALIEGTVADNVRMGSDARATDILEALRDTGLAEMDPERWISESAGDVSDGERRRLAVARALLRVRTQRARLVLLDEPTAGLDARNERAILDALRSLPVTVVVVTHRPEIIAAADRVVRLTSAALVAP